VWHPSLGNTTGAIIPPYAANTPTTARRIIIGNAIGDTEPNEPQRTGWVLGRHPDNNAINWFATDTSQPNDRRMYTQHGPPIMQATHLYPEWRSRFNFNLNGGEISGSSASIVRTVPESLTMLVNPTDQRVPTNITRSGATLLGWRQVNELGVPVNPAAAPLTSAQIEAITATAPQYWFRAVWAIEFEFFKGDMTVYSPTPENFTPLPGAVFVLERSTGPSTWEVIYTSQPSTAAGRVVIGSVFNWNLDMPATATQYRLRETVAPTDFSLPNGHWYIQIGGTPPVAMPTTSPTNDLYFRNVPITDEDGDAQDRWLVGNNDVSFGFWKTNHLGEIREGAVLSLFVYNNTAPGATAPPLVLLTDAMTAPVTGTWTHVSTQTSSLTEIMNFPIVAGRFYQMVETTPPVGYQLPMGQWRISVVPPAGPGGDASLNVTSVGGHMMPSITPRPGADPGVYNIMNRPLIVLPRTGGTAVRIFMYAGAFVTTAAMGILFYTKLAKKRMH